MACSKFLSFAEVVQGRDANVRITDDNLIYAVELNMAMSGKDRNNAGRDLRDLSDDVFPSTKFVDRKMSGKGCGHTKLVSFENAIELIMVLPGKVAKETRRKFANIIRRYMGGDKSLISEIEANAASGSPIAQLARASMHAPTSAVIISAEELEEKKRKREIEDTELHCKKLGNVKLFADTMALINPRWSEDARLRMQTEDWLKNVAFNSQLAITNGTDTSSGSGESTSISIGQIAQEHGKRLTHGQSVQAGGLVARKYKERYNCLPPKHSQWVDGAERKVNSYTERDRGLVMEALKELGILN